MISFRGLVNLLSVNLVIVPKCIGIQFRHGYHTDYSRVVQMKVIAPFYEHCPNIDSDIVGAGAGDMHQ